MSTNPELVFYYRLLLNDGTDNVHTNIRNLLENLGYSGSLNTMLSDSNDAATITYLQLLDGSYIQLSDGSFAYI